MADFLPLNKSCVALTRNKTRSKSATLHRCKQLVYQLHIVTLIASGFTTQKQNALPGH